MTVGQLEREMSLAELAEWQVEDLTRAADTRDAHADATRRAKMTPEERIAEELKAMASAGLEQQQRTRKRRS